MVRSDKATSFNGIFSRLGCYRKDSKELSGINKAGTIFFGIDGKYLANVQKKEIFELVGYGFSHEVLLTMPIEERRYYYHLLIEKNNPKKEDTTPLPKNDRIKFNPLGQ